jgi:hypothetical protein
MLRAFAFLILILQGGAALAKQVAESDLTVSPNTEKVARYYYNCKGKIASTSASAAQGFVKARASTRFLCGNPDQPVTEFVYVNGRIGSDTIKLTQRGRAIHIVHVSVVESPSPTPRVTTIPVVAGEEKKVWSLWNCDRDPVVVRADAQSGFVNIKDGTRNVCGDPSFPTKDVIYRSAVGFIGKDEVTIKSSASAPITISLNVSPERDETTVKAPATAPNTPVRQSRMWPEQWERLDAIWQSQLKVCWTYTGPAGVNYIPQIKVTYDINGILLGAPALLNPDDDPVHAALAASAMRAVTRCNPIRVPTDLRPFHLQWKARILRFDPQEMAPPAVVSNSAVSVDQPKSAEPPKGDTSASQSPLEPRHRLAPNELTKAIAILAPAPVPPPPPPVDTIRGQGRWGKLSDFGLINRERYSALRTRLLKTGWLPQSPTAEDDFRCNDGDDRCANRPEAVACAGTGLANCMFRWSRNGTLIEVGTVGESDPRVTTVFVLGPSPTKFHDNASDKTPEQVLREAIESEKASQPPMTFVGPIHPPREKYLKTYFTSDFRTTWHKAIAIQEPVWDSDTFFSDNVAHNPRIIKLELKHQSDDAVVFDAELIFETPENTSKFQKTTTTVTLARDEGSWKIDDLDFNSYLSGKDGKTHRRSAFKALLGEWQTDSPSLGKVEANKKSTKDATASQSTKNIDHPSCQYWHGGVFSGERCIEKLPPTRCIARLPNGYTYEGTAYTEQGAICEHGGTCNAGAVFVTPCDMRKELGKY